MLTIKIFVQKFMFVQVFLLISFLFSSSLVFVNAQTTVITTASVASKRSFWNSVFNKLTTILDRSPGKNTMGGPGPGTDLLETKPSTARVNTNTQLLNTHPATSSSFGGNSIQTNISSSTGHFITNESASKEAALVGVIRTTQSNSTNLNSSTSASVTHDSALLHTTVDSANVVATSTTQRTETPKQVIHGKNSMNSVNAVNAANAANSVNSINSSINGVNGVNGVNTINGVNRTNMVNGVNGVNGFSGTERLASSSFVQLNKTSTTTPISPTNKPTVPPSTMSGATFPSVVPTTSTPTPTMSPVMPSIPVPTTYTPPITSVPTSVPVPVSIPYIQVPVVSIPPIFPPHPLTSPVSPTTSGVQVGR